MQTIDPSVFTLNPANTPGVVSLLDVQDILHLWVWPQSQGFAAAGQTWEKAQFALSACGGGGASACLQSSDPLSRTLIVQIALPKPVSGVVQSASKVALPKAASWQALSSINPRPAQSSWFYDSQQRSAWLCLVAKDAAAGVQLNF